MTYYRRSLAPTVWGVVVALAIVAALWFTHARAVDNAYQRGMATAVEGARFDATLAARADSVVVLRTVRTDTITQRVTVTRWRVDTLVTQLAPEIRTLPAVDTLVGVVQTLTVAVDSMVVAHAFERMAWTEKAKVDSAALYSVRVMLTAKGDEVERLQKRPKWRTVAAGVVVGAVAGLLR